MDYTLGDTLYLMFTTRRFSTGAPFTLAGTPVVSAYEDNSLTQITAGITLGVDHDSVTGLNLLTIVATSGNGFEAGKQYNLVITTGTVDSVSAVGEVVGTFSIEAEAAFTRLGAPAGASVSADIAAIEAQTDDIGVAGAGLTGIPWNAAWDAEVQSEVNDALVAYDAATGSDVSALNNLSAAQVNAEVVDALNVDTYAEPGQGTPAATLSLAAKINYLFKAWRNRSTQTATTYSLYNDDATTVDQKATVSDDGTTADKGEVVTGP